MIKNDKDEEKQHLMNKLIIATFLALFGSLISTIFITSADAADIVSNEIQMPGTQPNREGNGGMTPDLHTVKTTNVSGNWDSVTTMTTFTLE